MHYRRSIQWTRQAHFEGNVLTKRRQLNCFVATTQLFPVASSTVHPRFIRGSSSSVWNWLRVVVPKYARDAGSRVTVCPVRPDPGHFRDQEIPEDRAVGGAMRSFVAHWSDVIVSFLIHHVEPDFENICLLQHS